MIKNTASQVIGAQVINASTGAAFASTVTVYVTGDGGTQTLGGTGSGVCTDEGNGFFSYVPTQAETNYAHVAFTFTGTGAIPVTVQCYPTYPQTADVGVRVPDVLNTTASGNIGIDWANIENTSTSQTFSLTTVGATSVCTSVLGFAAGSITSTAIATGAIDADALAADAVAEIADGVWDELLNTGHSTANSAAVYLSDILVDTGTTLPTTLATAQADLNIITGTNGVLVDDNAITAAKIATGAIDADALATDAAAEIAQLVWDVDATSHQTTGTFGAAIGDPVANTETIYDAVVTDAAGTNVAADIIALDTVADGILLDTAEIGAAGAGLTEAGGTGDQFTAIPWNAAWDAEVQSEVDDAIDTAISELGVGAPTATPTLRTGMMLMYMALRNKLVVQTSGTDALEIYNDAGTKIASKLITDNGSDYTEAEMS